MQPTLTYSELVAGQLIARSSAVDHEGLTGFNKELQARLRQRFHPLGIVAYSNCCRLGCTDAYDDCPGFPDFELRSRGIIFIKLFLNGMNYKAHVKTVYVQYEEDYEYLVSHWEEEKGLLVEWCEVVQSTLGLPAGGYTIEQPKDVSKCIIIHFPGSGLQLEDEIYDREGKEDY